MILLRLQHMDSVAYPDGEDDVGKVDEEDDEDDVGKGDEEQRCW